jgi:hypothetical protein
MAIHQLGCIAEFLANHARVIAAIVFEGEVLVVNDHGRIDVSYLLLISDSILRELRTCSMSACEILALVTLNCGE